MGIKYKPKVILGPGDSIREELEYYNWTQKDLSEILNITEKHLSNILNNKVPISIEIARALSSVFKQSPEYWINLDTNYRLRLQDSAIEDNISAKALVFRYMPINQMRKLGWISEDKSKLIEEVKLFWQIEKLNFDFLDSKISAYFRKSTAYRQFNPYYAYAWLQKARIEVIKVSTKTYDRKRLEQLSKEISKLSNTKDGINLFLNELDNCGVIFLNLPHLKQTYTDGASFMSNGNPVIIYTARLNRDDNFWWTVTHEIGHILYHLKSNAEFFIDSVDKIDSGILEEEADAFTNHVLLSEQILVYFRDIRSITKLKIEQCSKELNISPSIIVGCLQFNKVIPYTHLNRIKSKFIN